MLIALSIVQQRNEGKSVCARKYIVNCCGWSLQPSMLSRQQAGSSKASKAGEGAAQPAKYGFTPRLSRLRSEVLSLLAEGHRIDQPQARQVSPCRCHA